MIALDTNILIYACDKADFTGVISQNAVSGPRAAQVRDGDYTSKWIAEG